MSRCPRVVFVAAACLAAVGCQPTPPPSTPVRFAFDGATLPYGSAQHTASNSGRAVVKVVVSSVAGGRITSAPARSGQGRAIRFPTFDHTAPAAQAAYVVTHAAAADPFDPGTGRLEFGADITLDASSADLSPSSIDDGDNVFQRGVYDDVTQWKLEVDHRQPVCRVKGRSGALTVFSTVKLAAGRWYRTRCLRQGQRVMITVTWWLADGSTRSSSSSKTGATGDLRPSSASTPLAIGARVANGHVDADPDQYNGAVDNVVVTIG